MSIQPPKIDNRSYDEIVDQTVKLAQHFTADIWTALVERTSEGLENRILAEDIIDIGSDNNEIIATADTLVTPQLAKEIATRQAANLVKVKVKDSPEEQGNESVKPTPELLKDRILNENIIDIDGQIIAKTGESVNDDLAKKIAEVKTKLVKVKGWQGKNDAGMGLIRIFGRMAALVSDRLNQAPDKNFLAFLDLIGTQLLPPQPAKVPLTFSLVERSPVDALVPAHTQVAAPPADEQEEEVVFETDRELVVTTAQLKAVFVREPEKDKYSDLTSQATDEKGNAAFEAFTGEQPIEHCLYLACDELFTLPGTKTVTLTINSPQASELAKFQLSWSYWDGLTWKQLQPANPPSPPTTSQWQVQLHLPVPIKCKINGLEAGWLRVRLDTSLSQNLTQLPHIDSVSVEAEIKSSDIAPDLCFFNTVPIDLSKDFYPFGEQPRFNDTLYIASQEVFAISGAKVTIDLQLSDALPLKTDGGVEIAWEVWDGHNWKKLETTTILTGQPITEPKTSPANFTNNGKVQFTLSTPNPPNIVNGETTYWVRARIIKGNYGTAISQATTIAILTEDSQTHTENSKTVTVLAVNSVRGFMPNDSIQIVSSGRNPENKPIQSIDFDKKMLTLEGKITPPYLEGTSVMLLLDSAFGPPSVKPLSLSYEYKSSSFLSACCAYNDFHYVDLLTTTLREEAKSRGNFLKLASIAGLAKGDRLRINGGGTNPEDYEIETIDLSNKTVTLKQALNRQYNQGTQVVRSFAPFTPTADQSPTLYLGFDKCFPNRSIALYLQVESPQPGEITKATQNGNKLITDSPRIIWEYYNSKDWVSLEVQDGTNAFTQRGVIEFIGPHDFTSRSEFGQTLYWIRARCEGNEFLVQPRLRRILTNTIWASQVTTIKEELLGSSNGNPDRIFRTAQKPVLKGQQLEVQEAKIPSPEELAVIRSQEGGDAVKEVKDEAGQIEAVWVRWHKVRDFYGSGSRDRHYVLDRLTGEVRFGNGQYGMVPPQGRNNIRLSQYQTGGGKRGNLDANMIVQLKTTVPYVEKVTNLEAAGGGSEQESLERVKERGPKWLRHRDRAVTIQDFEDLAYEASPDVARAKANELKFNPREMQWIPIFRLSLSKSGDITVTLTELQDSKSICVQIYGSGKATPYAEQTLNNGQTFTYTVTQEQYDLGKDLGKEWTVILTNSSKEDKELVKATVEIVYPTGSIAENLQIPPRNAPPDDYNPYQKNAEVVKLILVPHSRANQPTPSIALLDRVKQYISDRSSPALQLQVTEPNWVKVSVTATIVPVSWESADRVKAAALNRLQEFLHPLTGAKKHRGWEFGRYPYESDLYAALEEIEGVDYVESLSIKPEKLPDERQEQCLIFSGSHQVNLGGRST
ncbi:MULTISPECIES: baseplate J/gp47 family protein [unclassified Microcoleus]|uniref:baseplate J/gp47 family protein n=1 Tax=unclassified Microcoleus TaxID=2642155 RepID=UPI002FD10110